MPLKRHSRFVEEPKLDLKDSLVSFSIVREIWSLSKLTEWRVLVARVFGFNVFWVEMKLCLVSVCLVVALRDSFEEIGTSLERRCLLTIESK